MTGSASLAEFPFLVKDNFRERGLIFEIQICLSLSHCCLSPFEVIHLLLN